MLKIKSLPFSFVNHLQEIHFKKDEMEQVDLEALLSQLKQINNLPFSHLPAFFVIDYTKQDYLLMSEGSRQISNYRPEAFIESGLEMLLDIYHKDDFRIYNEQIFSINHKFLQSVPQAEHRNYVFTYTFRIRNGNGGISHIFQRGNYITNSAGQPVYSLGMILNITGLYNDHIMFHSIEKEGTGLLDKQEVIQQNYFTLIKKILY